MDMRKAKILLLIFVLGFFAVGCGNRAKDAAIPKGRILLWHTWTGNEEEALDRLLGKFHDVYPELTVISAAYSEDELKAEFEDKVLQGLGPDLLIGTQRWLPDLAEAGLIQELDEQSFDASSYLTTAMNTLRYKDRLYGLPLSVRTSALFYNQKQIKEAPETLDALLELAEDGHKVALNTSFSDAFWGIQAFGGRLLDSEGRIVLNQGGFTNWLEWLVEAQNIPNVILSNDDEVLYDLFVKGEIAFYVGLSSKLLALQEILGEDNVGVAALPAGPTDAAGPFLESEPLFLSTASSKEQSTRAMLLAQFLTNVEQQRKMAQLAGRIPANPRVRIDRRVSPAVAGFVEQSKTAVPLLLIPQMSDAIEFGEETYVQTLEGLSPAVDAVNLLTAQINERYGMDTIALLEESERCAFSGSIDLWHGWPQEREEVLHQIGENFTAFCPDATILFTPIQAEELQSRYEEAVRAGAGPDLLLISSESATQLASADLVSNISELIEPSFLQRYVPTVPDTMRYEGKLFGLPIVVDTLVLYYNADMVEEPPIDLGDLLSQVGPERPIAFAYTPYRSIQWGASAFGGRLFNTDGALALEDGGFVEWLEWLREAKNQPGVMLTRRGDDALEQFASGNAAYYVGSQNALRTLWQRLGAEKVRVAHLPGGPEGSSGPVLDVDGLMLNPISPNDETAVAIAFAKFATETENQALLMTEADVVPANANIENISTAYPAIAGFMEQAKTAIIPPNRIETNTIFRLGDTIYENVLEHDADPSTILHEFTTFITTVHGITNTDVNTGEVAESCGENGNLLVWHSLTGKESGVMEQIIADFARNCPDVLVETEFIAAEELPNQLAARSQEALEAQNDPQEGQTAESDSTSTSSTSDQTPADMPDLVLTAHDLIAPLSQERLIKPVTPWVAAHTLIPYLPPSIDAMTFKEALYGLPFNVETMALYYNASLTNGEVDSGLLRSIDDLLAQASPSTPLALNTSFQDAFWGVLAFGRHGVQLESDDVTQNMLSFEQTGLVEWLSWLQDARDRPGIVMSDDGAKLQEMFAAGNAAYLVAGPTALGALRSELNGTRDDTSLSGTGEETVVKVTSLPRGGGGIASPFVTVNGFLFSAAVSEEQTKLAVKFAEFATSGESQALLVQDAQLVPANQMAMTSVRDLEIESFMQQIDAGTLRPPRPDTVVLFEGGDILYQNVLLNGHSPQTAVDKFTEFVEKTPRPAVIAYTGNSVLNCEYNGTIVLWHTLALQQAARSSGIDPLEQIISDFTTQCPGAQIDAEYVANATLAERYRKAVDEGTGPDLLLGPHHLIGPLSESGIIQPISHLVDDALLAEYLPKTVEAVAHQGLLYGLPQAMDVMALYYNADLVATPVSTLDELWEVASPKSLVALDNSFYGAYWGVSAFGGELVNGEGQIVEEQDGFVRWLEWLRAAQDRSGILLATDSRKIQQAFSNGEAAYLVAGSAALAPLRARLGNRVRVIPLPSGPDGNAGPLLRINTFMFNATSEVERIDLAVAFASFATSDINQTLLRQELNSIPTNRVAAETTDDSAILTFIKQAIDTSIVLPHAYDLVTTEIGDAVYARMFKDDIDPLAAVTQLVEAAIESFKQSDQFKLEPAVKKTDG